MAVDDSIFTPEQRIQLERLRILLGRVEVVAERNRSGAGHIMIVSWRRGRDWGSRRILPTGWLGPVTFGQRDHALNR